MESWLLGCPSTAFIQKRRAGGKSSSDSFCLSQEGKTGSEPAGTTEEKEQEVSAPFTFCSLSSQTPRPSPGAMVRVTVTS